MWILVLTLISFIILKALGISACKGIKMYILTQNRPLNVIYNPTQWYSICE